MINSSLQNSVLRSHNLSEIVYDLKAIVIVTSPLKVINVLWGQSLKVKGGFRNPERVFLSPE